MTRREALDYLKAAKARMKELQPIRDTLSKRADWATLSPDQQGAALLELNESFEAARQLRRDAWLMATGGMGRGRLG